MDNRYRSNNGNRDRWSQGYRQDDFGRQQEQFSDSGSQQYGERSVFEQEFARENEGRGYGGRGGYDRSDSTGYQNRSYNSSGYNPLGEYDRGDRGSYGANRGQSQDYSGSSYGSGGYGNSSYGGNRYGTSGFNSGEAGIYSNDRYSAGSRGGYKDSSRNDTYRSDNNRGFFERAGDEVASWFGDEDATRRRERDHGGRGPANYTRSNERMLELACEKLTEDRGVDASNIQVTADNNEITLDGTVGTRWEKRRAEDVVSDLSGVKHVQNNLRVAESTSTGTTSTSGTTSSYEA